MLCLRGHENWLPLTSTPSAGLNGQGDGYCPRDLTAPNRALCSLSYTLFEIGLVNEAMLDLSGGFQAAFFLGKLRASFCMAKLASPFGFIGT